MGRPGYACCRCFYNIRYWRLNGTVKWSRAWDDPRFAGTFPTYVGRLSNADIVVCGQPTTDGGYTLKRYDQDGGLMWAVDCRDLTGTALDDHYPDCLAVRGDDRIVVFVTGVTTLGYLWSYGVEVSAADGTVLRYTSASESNTAPSGRNFKSKTQDGVPYFIRIGATRPIDTPSTIVFRWLQEDSEFTGIMEDLTGSLRKMPSADFVVKNGSLFTIGTSPYTFFPDIRYRLGSMPAVSHAPASWDTEMWGSYPTGNSGSGTMDAEFSGPGAVIGGAARHPSTGNTIGCALFNTLLTPSGLNDSSHFVRSMNITPWKGGYEDWPFFLRIIPAAGYSLTGRFISHGIDWKPSMYNYSADIDAVEWRHLHGAYQILAPDASGNTVGCGRGNWLGKDDQSFLDLA